MIKLVSNDFTISNNCIIYVNFLLELLEYFPIIKRSIFQDLDESFLLS